LVETDSWGRGKVQKLVLGEPKWVTGGTMVGGGEGES